MANQVLQSADEIFNHEIKANVSRSVFNLSHVHSFDADFGGLYPFYYQYTLPNDSFDLKAIVKVKALPLESPLYTAIHIRTAFYFVPFYLLWHHFDKFLEGGRDGTYTTTPPILGDSSTGITFSKGSVADYFGLPVGVHIPSADCPDAMPFFAYQRIWRDYYFDQDIQSDSNINVLFPEDEFDFQLADGFQTAITGTPYDSNDLDTGTIDLNEIRYRNWDKDYFTSAMPMPQRGPIAALPLSGTADAPVTVNDWKSYLVSTPVVGETYRRQGLEFSKTDTSVTPPTESSFDMTFRSDGTPLNRVNVQGYSSGDSVFGTMSSDEIKKIPLIAKVNFANAGTFTVDDLRLATQLQLWLERNMRTRAEYTQFLRIHFNDAPIDLRLTRPYYIGGTSQQLIVSEILQTSETTESSPLGSMAGTGSSFDQNFVGKYNSHEFGIIIGLMSIMPDTMYTQGMPREFNKRTRYDYYFPEFAQLSPQAILTKELYCTDNAANNSVVFGYQGRFDELRHRRNYVSGALRDPNMKDFYTWTMARVFSSAPTLTNSFINSKGTVRHDAFTTGDNMNPFIVQTGVECRAVRPLPVVNVPMALL